MYKHQIAHVWLEFLSIFVLTILISNEYFLTSDRILKNKTTNSQILQTEPKYFEKKQVYSKNSKIQKVVAPSCAGVPSATVNYPFVCISSLPFATLFFGRLTLIDEDSMVQTFVLAYVYTDDKAIITSNIGKMTNLRGFIGYSDSLQGNLPSQIGLLSYLIFIFISQQKLLEGTLPTEIGKIKTIERLEISNCALDGSLPSEIGTLSKLTKLALGYNYFSGVIPSEIGLCSKLEFMQLNDNKLVGSIPSEFGMLGAATYIRLKTNNLDGTIPSELGCLSSIKFLNIGNGLLSGVIPSQLGLIPATLLWMGENQISGNIPSELGKMKGINALEIYQNNINGSLPSELGTLSLLNSLYLQQNNIIGTLPSQYGLLNYMTLNISFNKMSGSIPIEIYNNNRNLKILCENSGLNDPYFCGYQSISFVYLNQTIYIVCSSIIGFLLIVIIITGILIFRLREHPIIRATNYRFGIISLIGLFVLSCSIFPFGVTLSDFDHEIKAYCCQLFSHLVAHGIVIVMSCIIARNYPIWKVFDNPKMKPIHISPSKLLYFVFGALIVNLFLTIPFSVYLDADRENFGCSVPNDISRYLFISLCLYVIFIAIIACWMCMKIRNVPSQFNNTKDVANATFNLLTFGLAMIIVGTVATNAVTLFLSCFFSIFVSVVIFTILVHVKKINQALAVSSDSASAQLHQARNNCADQQVSLS